MGISTLSLVALALVPASAALSCPYASLKTGAASPQDVRVLVAGELCGANATEGCVLTSACTLVDKVGFTDLTDAMYWVGITHIGDLSAYTKKFLFLRNAKQLDLNAAKFPPTIESIVMERSGLASIPAALEWPPKLTSLNLRFNGLTQIPRKLPTTQVYASLDLSNNNIERVDYVPLAKNLQLNNNSYTALESVDLSATVVCNFSYPNPTSTFSIANVKFSSVLTDWECYGCIVPSFHMDADTYATFSKISTSRAIFASIDSRNACTNNTVVKNIPQTDRYVCVAEPAPTTAPPPPPSNSSSTVAVIASLVAGGVVLLGVLAVCAWWKRQTPPTSSSHNLFEKTDGDDDQDQDEDTYESYNQLHNDLVTVVAENSFAELEAFRLDRSKLKPVRLLARGGFGEVWQGTYHKSPVAIKRLLEDVRTVAMLQKFIHEVKLLARLESPYVVRFIGVSWVQLFSMELVVEFMDRGDLRDALLHRTSSKSFPWSEKIACARDVVRGIVYMHDLNIIHRDIKARNVLLDSTKPCKLSDFGVSREIHSKTMTQEVGTCRWAAPEILHGGRFSLAADVFSFGMLLVELDTHELPYQNQAVDDEGETLLEVTIMMRVMDGSIRPQVSPTCPKPIKTLVERCTQFDPTLRPTIAQVLASLPNEL